MPLALSPEQVQLAESVTRFAARHAPIVTVRAASASLADGELPPWWDDLVTNGFHAVHLPEDVGGQGGRLADLACVIEASATALLPGPLLSTTIASAIVATAQRSDNTASLLKDLAAGSAAAVVLPETSHLEATKTSEGWSVSGRSGYVSGLCAAQKIILCARVNGDDLWLALDRPTADTAVRGHRGTDLTTDVGTLHLNDHVIPSHAVLQCISAERAHCIAVSLTASAAVGISQWCVSAVTTHLKTREQFGRPIGGFQALQHKAATMFVNTELAVAAAWDATEAADETTEQHRLAADAAAVVAVSPAADLALEALTLFGAIGYTWEHDLHLYWRKAISLSASIGGVFQAARRATECTRSHTREAAISLGDADADFRYRISDLLDHACGLPGDDARDDDERRPPAPSAQRSFLADNGLVAPHWPTPWGLSATPLQQLIIEEEFTKRPALSRPLISIGAWIVPAILRAGSARVREMCIAPTLHATLTWCQLFSEPEAGSDLASLKTRATKVEGGWLITGHKIWTSTAQTAHYGGLLARTDPTAAKHRGIGYFVLDMTSPGIDVRPIQQVTGRAEFNEVFLTEVFVPDDMLLGEPCDGWQLATTTLSAERVTMTNNTDFDRSGSLARLLEDADIESDTYGILHSYANTIKALQRRETLRLLDGQQAGPAASIAKVATNMLLRRAAATLLALGGELGMVDDSDPPVLGPYFDIPSELIGGGTLEIQLNIVAQNILRLPRK
jgi:alkylation response protein AidB-like acyl-CoA dehydrogenase